MSDYVFFGAAAGLIAMCWNYLRTIWIYLRSILIVRVTLEEDACMAVQYYLQKYAKESRFGDLGFSGSFNYINSERVTCLVLYRVIPYAGRVYFYRGAPLWVLRHDARNQTNFNINVSMLNLTFIRGTLDITQFLCEVTKTYNDDYHTHWHGTSGARITHIFGTVDKSQNTSNNGLRSGPSFFHVDAHKPTDISRIPLTHSSDDIGQRSSHGVSLAEMSLDDTLHNFVSEFERWVTSKQWYNAHNISWRRGWLFTGPPGTGKTSIARAVAQQYSLPVFSIHIETMFNDELFDAWDTARQSSPCIVLIEDIDATFKGRETIRGKLTFDALLNCIDGIASAEGIALIITTNFPESLDVALASGGDTASRPGRIDRIVKFDALTEAGRYKMIRRILAEYPELHEQLVTAHAGETAAQFQDTCTRVALTKYWEKMNGLSANCAAVNGAVVGDYLAAQGADDPRATRQRDAAG